MTPARRFLQNSTVNLLTRLNITRAFNFCKSASRILICKALDLLFSMDDNIFPQEEDFFDVCRSPTLTLAPLSLPSSSSFDEEEDYEEKVYLVPYRWWKEARESLYGEKDDASGVLYTCSPGNVKIVNDGFDSEIALSMRREDCYKAINYEEEGNSLREYALVPEATWIQALKWHDDINEVEENVWSLSAAEEYMPDVFLLQIRLSVLSEINSLVVKISRKGNTPEVYSRASNILGIETEPLHIWDFSGQTTLLFKNDTAKLPHSNGWEPDKEVLLELQVYELPNSMRGKEGVKDEMSVEMTKREDSFCESSFKVNGSLYDGNFYFRDRSCTGASFLGLRGLRNLGNTCFMNSAIQCLVHAPKFVDYFLGDYRKEINKENPLGMRGELASAFGELLRMLWFPGRTPVVPRMFKLKISSFAPQFSGYNQHDSQEFLAFLLDGLHEDLNRVKCKPYIEARDADGLPDEEVADEYWRNHQARNDSVVVDLLQGQYRSTLICPICKKLSVTFDPFMYLSLPVPSATMRTMTVTVFNTNGTTLPTPLMIRVPKFGTFKDLIQALSNACSLRNDETLLVAEIHYNHIVRFLEDPSDKLELVRDDDQLVAYRLPREAESSPLIVFSHYRAEKAGFHDRRLHWKMFGTPLVSRISNLSSGTDIRKQFLKLISSFSLTDSENASNDDGDYGRTATAYNMMDESTATAVGDADSTSEDGDDDPHLGTFQFHYADNGPVTKASKIKMNGPLPVSQSSGRLDVSVCWPDKMVDQYDTSLLSTLSKVFKFNLFERSAQESVSFYKCLELFLKEEPLGPEDMWYCPSCKTHQQAIKKLDLWRFPELLVIHLKRFSYSRFFKTKLETFVDFPVRDLDLSEYVAPKESLVPHHYMLYAVINHYGSMGGGHYTAFVQRECGKWYDFDDSSVHPVTEDQIKTSAAYVLFYRRISDANCK